MAPDIAQGQLVQAFFHPDRRRVYLVHRGSSRSGLQHRVGVIVIAAPPAHSVEAPDEPRQIADQVAALLGLEVDATGRAVTLRGEKVTGAGADMVRRLAVALFNDADALECRWL